MLTEANLHLSDAICSSGPSRDPAGRPVRVAHLITNLAMGGAERFLIGLLTEMNGFSSLETRLYLLNSKATFFAVPRGLPSSIVGFDSPWRDVQAVLRASRALRALLIRDQIDVLHTHLWICDFLGALAVRGTPVKHVSHTHNTLDWMTSRRLGFQLRRRVLATCLSRARTRFVSCSLAAEEHLRAALRVSDFEGVVIPYGVNVRAFPFVPLDSGRLGPASRRFVVGMAGRHVRSKGHHVLIDALSLLEASGDVVEALVAGEGEHSPAIAQYARDRLERTAFNMIGPVRDMPAFLRGIDLLVQPSLAEEGLPVTILEAMCSGIPVLASDDAGAPEIIEDGVNGFLVPRGDAKGIADRIRHIRAMDPHQLQALKESARATILARCAAPAVAARVASVYAAIMRGERISAFSTTARVGAVQQITA